MGKPATEVPIFLGVAVKGSDQMKTLLLKTAITAQGSSEVADADQDDIPSSIGAEDPLDAFDELLNPVADASLSNGAQV